MTWDLNGVVSDMCEPANHQDPGGLGNPYHQSWWLRASSRSWRGASTWACTRMFLAMRPWPTRKE
eukprot:10213977-Lingulodinium_polyedra.AAC.1